MENKNVLLSIKDLEVKFHVRGRILTAIRGINLDIYENESIAIVGESGSGKSVFTKTFAGMLDENGFISNGSLMFYDDELADTHVTKNFVSRMFINIAHKDLDKNYKFAKASKVYKQILELKSEKKQKMELTEEEHDRIDANIEDLKFKAAETYNYQLTLDTKTQKVEYEEAGKKIAELNKEVELAEKAKKNLIKEHKNNVLNDKEYNDAFNTKMNELNAEYNSILKEAKISEKLSLENNVLAKEIYLSVGRYPFFKRFKFAFQLLKALKKASKLGVDLRDDEAVENVFKTVVFRVKYLDETEEKLHGVCKLDLAAIKYTKDWQQIRGRRVATVFQDPMSSLNPIITIGEQITSIILKHQNCSELEARERAVELMKKVGIPNAETRFDDYPFQYSGGMRQRIVIAIALSCQPKILICDEPTTALDVTIQAQILRLIKDLQKEFGYTIVFITHDLGVVANIADRVAVLYAGQIVELGTVEEVFYDPHHPYTWALLSSLPQLAERGEKLYSITGTPPSLYNKIVGDPFAPRNPHCLKIDTLVDSPMFKITETHYAKTWLLDPRAPKVEKPKIIQDIHKKLLKAFNIEEVK